MSNPLTKKFKSRNFFGVVMLLLTCCVLSSCGTKGALYIPEQQYPQGSAAEK